MCNSTPTKLKLKLEVLKSDFQHKKEEMNTDKLAINWQNFARVRLQLEFAFIIRPSVLSYVYRSAKFDAIFFARLFILFYFLFEKFRTSVNDKNKLNMRAKKLKNFASVNVAWSYVYRSAKFDAKFFNIFARLFILLSVRKVSYIDERQNKINKRAKKLKNIASRFADR